MTDYYVSVEGEVVAGPFDSKDEAKRRRDDLNTYEVGGRYEVTSESG